MQRPDGSQLLPPMWEPTHLSVGSKLWQEYGLHCKKNRIKIKD